MARGAPGASVGTGTATLLWAAADAAGFAFDAPADAGAGAFVGDLGAGHLAAGAFALADFAAGDFAGAGRVAGDFVGRATGFFFAAGATRALAPRAGAVFFAGVALRTGVLLVGFLFAAAGFFVIVTFFFAGTLLPLAGAALRGAGFAVGRAGSLFAADFFAVFLAAGFFTGSPRNGAATLSRKARREGAANFGRGGL